MRFFVIAAALLHLTFAGHIEIKMPYLNSAGVTYVQGQEHYAAPAAYYPNHYQAAYDGHNAFAYHQAPVKSVGVANIPVKTAVAVPTVQHVPAVADVPVTKIEAQPAILQKLVEVAKPAIKTRKFEIRRPAIQKQFYDIEERILVRPVGSALVELEEPLSKTQKGPALVSTVEDHHHQQAVLATDHHHVAVAHDHHHVAPAIAVTAAPAIAVTAPVHTVAITPAPHHVVSTIAPTHAYEHHYEHAPAHHYEHAPAHHYEHVLAHHYEQAPAHHYEHAPAHYEHAPAHYEQQYVAHAEHLAHADHYVAKVPVHVTTPHAIVSSTPAPHYDAVVVEAEARNAAAKEAAYARAHLHNVQHGVESYSHGAPHEHVLVKQAPQEHLLVKAAPVHVDPHAAEHLRHEIAQDNQQKLIKLLTAKGGVSEVGFEHHGHLEPVGDAGISKARVLSATPTPHHEPVEEKYKTRRIVVSRPVQTVQEIDVVEPATKIEQVAVQQPGYIKTAKVGYERVHTSVPVLGKALAPAIAHAQVPVEYYHH